jgi:uncharacterized Fe-S center protein
MATGNRRAGIIYLRVDGELQEAKGSFSYNLGNPKRDAIIGSDGVHGYKETVQVAFIEGAVTDAQTLNLGALTQLDGVTVHLELNNGKTIVLSNAWFAGEGTPSTEEAEIPIRFESKNKAQEV